ncbi:hypothetical protein NDU88_000381 [Pleurodeles waltl]|uniref:Ig-like domain-containing protein n=1 Tax=Pleurodeles waltl TaxID=8319 RepID=A0AAV7P420_PLEWA|nr:hypothetical protein NDU88_000381 [Pleurodeles waltl]
MNCEHDDPSSVAILWYRQHGAQGVTLLATSVSGSDPTFEDSFQSGYEVSRPHVLRASLKILSVTEKDAATYFCAASTQWCTCLGGHTISALCRGYPLCAGEGTQYPLCAGEGTQYPLCAGVGTQYPLCAEDIGSVPGRAHNFRSVLGRPHSIRSVPGISALCRGYPLCAGVGTQYPLCAGEGAQYPLCAGEGTQ